jgi:spore germination protein
VIILIVYVVKPGDTIYSIAKQYGVSPEVIISENQLANPSQLVVGQSLVIPQGQRVYLVRAGDTLYTIGRQFGVTPESIMGENPDVDAAGHIYQGQILVIPPPGRLQTAIEVNGYTFPSSDMSIVVPALPSLTYLSIFSYQVKPDGSLDAIDDSKWITLARNNHVAPVMVITNIRATGGFDSDIGHSVLTNEQAQNNLINNIVSVMQQKNYYALNIDFEYIYPYDRQSYNQFLRKITDRLHSLGYPVMTAVAPKLSAAQTGLLYEAHDYPFHGATVDKVILMTYEWGYLSGPPQAVAPLNQVKRVLDYAVSVIPRNKILMGIPNYGYDWVLPYVRGTKATTFSNVEAVARALRNKADIKYDAAAQSPYFNYYDSQKRQHIAWFEDARSIVQKLNLVDEYKLAGISYWTIERPFPQNLVVLNSMYNVKKVV